MDHNALPQFLNIQDLLIFKSSHLLGDALGSRLISQKLSFLLRSPSLSDLCLNQLLLQTLQAIGGYL